MNDPLVFNIGDASEHLVEDHFIEILRVIQSLVFVIRNHLVEVIRDVVHDDIEKSLLQLKILSEEEVVNLDATGMVQQLNYLELPVGKLGILEHFFDGELSIGHFLYHLEDLSEGALSYGLYPLIEIRFVLGAFLGRRLLRVDSLRGVFPSVSSGIFKMQIFIFSH